MGRNIPFLHSLLYVLSLDSRDDVDNSEGNIK